MTAETDAERFASLDRKSFVPRTLGYLRHIGPGYMQSAMTLGGGTASPLTARSPLSGPWAPDGSIILDFWAPQIDIRKH